MALQSAGEYDSKEVRDGIAYLRQFGQGIEARAAQSSFLLRAVLRGPGDVAAGREVRGRNGTRTMRDDLLNRQQAEGYWKDDGVCKEYGTAMALIVLQIPNDFLPIFQR